MGCGYSRQRGFSMAKGKYVVFIDDDDYYTDNRFFAKAVDIMEENDEIVAVFGGSTSINVVTGEETKNAFMPDGLIEAKEYLRGYHTIYPAPFEFVGVMKRQHLLNVGVGQMKMLNHMPMHMRCLTAGKVYCIHDSVGMYRVHDTNISKSISADFIIDNLQEKLQIYQLVKTKKLFDDYLNWWYRQIEVTVGYFVYNFPLLAEFKKIKHWCVTNSDGNKDIVKLMKKFERILKGDSLIIKIKRKIKKILRR